MLASLEPPSDAAFPNYEVNILVDAFEVARREVSVFDVDSSYFFQMTNPTPGRVRLDVARHIQRRVSTCSILLFESARIDPETGSVMIDAESCREVLVDFGSVGKCGLAHGNIWLNTKNGIPTGVGTQPARYQRQVTSFPASSSNL